MSHVPPTVLLLGHPTWHRGDVEQAIALPQKAFVLLALLHLAFENRASRSKLAALLYEDADQAGALANFRQLLMRVLNRQKATGIDLVISVGNEVRLVETSDAPRCDLAVLRGLATPGDEAQLAALSSLYRGDLLENVGGCGEHTDGWIGTQRTRLRDRYGDLTLAGAAVVRGLPGETAVRRLLEWDPYREDAWRMLIDLRAENRGVASAEAIHDEMRSRFDRDLKAAPDPQTTALIANLMRSATPQVRAKVSRELAPEAGAGLVRPGSIVPAIPRLCLLMPTHNGVEPTQTLLAEALIEDVTLGLCRLRSIAVIAPHTAWRLSGEPLSGDRFGIEYFGETSVRSFCGEVRLVVKLVRDLDRMIVWADEYLLAPGAPPEHYRELSCSIVLALADSIERAETARFEMVRQPDAYQLYLTGLHHLHVLDLPAIRRARRAFSQAVDLSPVFVPALNGVARTLILEWLLLATTEPDLLRHAQGIARRAVEIDPFSGEALREAANASLFQGGLDEAIEGLAGAERLAPHHADILADYANALTHSSELQLALRRIEKAIELNPMPPDNYLWKAGGTLFFLENYDGALGYLNRMKRPEPAFRLAAACLAMAGRRVEASEFVRKALEDQPNFRIDDWIATIPLRSKDHMVRYVSALRDAGFT